MWRVGQDATLRMTVGALVLFDRPPSIEALTERLAFAMDNAPRLRRRPDDPSAMRARPAWVDDPEPAAGRHVRSLSVSPPGSTRQLLDLVALLESVPFDPDCSPWDVTLVEGLAEGRAALYLRAHHALTDGVGGIRFLGLLLDEPAWPRVLAATPPVTRARRAAEPSPDGDRRLGTFTFTVDLPDALRRLIGGVNAARDVRPTETAVRGVQRALDVANSVSRQLLVTGGPLSPRAPSRSVFSRFELITVESARAAALALGGSRNDLLVAAAASGLGHYYGELGHPAAELRLATPTSQRRGDEVGGNWFAPARLEVPTAVGRPGPQFGIVVERLAQARREPALQVASTVAATLGRLPNQLLLPALHAQADSVDFAATAVPGLRGTRHICGAPIDAIYPLGPRLGCPMNITAFGKDDRLDVGIALDHAAIEQPELLVECLTAAFDSYVTAALGGSTVD